MNSFHKKKDMEIISERIEIARFRINVKKRCTEEFLQNEENLNSYVRTMYLLGEPCWGRYSSLNNHLSHSQYYLKLNH